MIHHLQQQQPTLSYTTKRKFEKVPSEYQKTFYYDNKRQSHPLIRILRQRGWKQLEDPSKAQLVYTHYPSFSTYAKIKHRYQRYNLLPSYKKFCYVYDKIYYCKNYERRTNERTTYSIESYLITSLASHQEIDKNTNIELVDLNTFEEKYVTKGDNNNNNKYWVLQFPDNKALPGIIGRSDHTLFQKLAEKAKEYYKEKMGSNHNHRSIRITCYQQYWITYPTMNIHQNYGNINNNFRHIPIMMVMDLYVQKYVCRPLLFQGHTLKVRSYWFIASTNPLIIFYHDGYIQLEYGNNNSKNQNDDDDELVNIINSDGVDTTTQQHYYQRGTKIPFDTFTKSLDEQYDDKYTSKSHSHPLNKSRPSPSTIPPSQHVRNQIKDSISEMIQVYYTESFTGGSSGK